MIADHHHRSAEDDKGAERLGPRLPRRLSPDLFSSGEGGGDDLVMGGEEYTRDPPIAGVPRPSPSSRQCATGVNPPAASVADNTASAAHHPCVITTL